MSVCLGLLWLLAAFEGVSSKGRDAAAGFSILGIAPNQGSADGGTEVTIRLDSSLLGSVSCRFGDVIVPGRIEGERLVKCVAPRQAAGPVYLSVALNPDAWSNRVKFVYVGGRKVVYLAVLLLLIAAISIFVFLWQMRQCQDKQKHGSIAALDSGYYGKRENEVPGVKRKTVQGI